MSIKNYFIEDYWNIGVINKPISTFLTDDNFFQDISILKTSNHFFLADPFGLSKEGENKIYCEKFDFSTQLGTIVEVQVSDKNELLEISPILSLEDHLSFPFLWQYKNDLLMIPENAESGKLRSWHLNGEKEKTIINLPIIDPVLYESEGQYFLFCSQFDGTENIKTKLFFSSDIYGDWTEHKKSPICNDLLGGRMAGNIIEVENKKYRIAQNCTKTYGGGLSIYEILTIDTTNYIEVFVRDIEPPLGYMGIHTLNAFGDKTLIDLKTSKFSIMKPFYRFKRKFL